MNTEESSLPIWRLAMALLAAFSGVALSYHFSLGIERKLIIGFVRSIVQLLLLGYVLLNLIYSLNSPWIVTLYLLVMISIAAIEVANRQKLTYSGQYYDAWLCCFIGGGVSGIYASLIVFHPNPWWDPKVFIPTTGMIIGNSVSGPAVAIDRLFSDVNDKRHEVEVRLAFGATGFEALLPATRAAIIAAMTPNLNMLSIVGLVSIPGMMTGQLLGGATPLVAAQYQMAILFLLTTTTVISTYLAIKFATSHALISREHRLTPERLMKKAGPKLGLEAALWVSFQEGVQYLISVLTQRCCCLAYCSPLWSTSNSNTSIPYTPTATYTSLPQSSVELVSPIDEVISSSNSSVASGSTGHTPSSGSFKASYTISSSQSFPYIPLDSSSSSRRRPPLLTIRNVNLKVGEFDLFNQEGFSFTLQQGQRVVIEGCSGLGKTRLLRALAQLDPYLTGSMTLHTIPQHQEEGNVAGITLYGQDTVEVSVKVQHNDYASYAQWRSRVMYIPQALPPLAGTPIEFLNEVLKFKARKHSLIHSVNDIEDSCRVLEERILLPEGKLSQTWSTLSGGERQRAIIACGVLLSGALSPVAATEPSSASTGAAPQTVLLLDEPTAACDERACAAVEQLLIDSGVACIIVTHDSSQAERLAHTRISLLQ